MNQAKLQQAQAELNAALAKVGEAQLQLEYWQSAKDVARAEVNKHMKARDEAAREPAPGEATGEASVQ